MVASAHTACVFNVMRFATQDGPGIRTTVFFKGCPLSCWWCHNPESQNFQPDRMYFEERCRRCLDCVTACPQHAIQLDDGRISTSDACTCCGECTEVCMAEARQIVGRRYTVEELIAEVEKDLIFFDDSGGGVTLSGGEPLSQPVFAAEFLIACRDRGIGTVLETCGFATSDTFLTVALLADQIFFDLKFVDPEKHRLYTGVPGDRILRNLEALIARGHAVTMRIPVIPGINDSVRDVAQFAAYLGNLRPPRVELLPYHRTGAGKYQRLGLQYKIDETPEPSQEQLAVFGDVLRGAGLNVKVGG
jgi:pyruvate formate lyase activating enzyme